MIRMRFRIPAVGTERPPVEQSPCCRTDLIRHQKGHEALAEKLYSAQCPYSGHLGRVVAGPHRGPRPP
ncbi:MAG: hypothetical protein KAX44_02740, partial [Candidatus Brocadiae bacterium]|nr:hypothetical protein [Candidatus Brocadiia bacterium]